MNFFIIIACITIGIFLMIFYPIRKSPKLCLLLFPIILCLMGGSYARWGAYSIWQDYLHLQANQAIVKKIMQTPNGSEQLIEKLKVQLAKKPNSAKGWYLLGRLLANKYDWKAAETAFKKAHQLNTEDEANAVNYAQALWQNNNQQWNTAIRGIFKQLLKKNPNQPDALAMLAMDFFNQKDYAMAIRYWEKLLRLAPTQSEEAIALRKAIAKARSLNLALNNPSSE